MLQIVLILLSIYLIVNVYRKPENGLIVTLFVLAFGVLLDQAVFSNFKFILLLFIFFIELFHSLHKESLSIPWLLFSSVIIIKELISLLIGIGSASNVFMSLYVYIIIMSICLFSYKEINLKHVDFLKQLKVYVFSCFLVQLYRTFIDYSFFGFAYLESNKERYASVYQFGGNLFRPSNLESPITYAIEVALFCGLILFSSESNKKKIIWSLVSLVSILLTNSRSGLIMVVVAIAAFCFIKKKYVYALLLSVAGMLFVSLYGNASRMLSVFDVDSTYNSRLNSISTIVSQISSFSVKNLLLGQGYGSSNYVDSNGYVAFYVENFFLSLIVNSGLLIFMFFLVYLSVCVVKGIKRRHVNVILLCSLLIVNLFACSLLIYTIQIFFWYISFSLILNKYEEKMTLVKYDA